MDFDDLKNKAKDMISQHPDQADQGIDKAREFIDQKTGGKHSDQLQQGADKLEQSFGGNQNGDQNQGGDPNADQNGGQPNQGQ